MARLLEKLPPKARPVAVGFVVTACTLAIVAFVQEATGSFKRVPPAFISLGCGVVTAIWVSSDKKEDDEFLIANEGEPAIEYCPPVASSSKISKGSPLRVQIGGLIARHLEVLPPADDRAFLLIEKGVELLDHVREAEAGTGWQAAQTDFDEQEQKLIEAMLFRETAETQQAQDPVVLGNRNNASGSASIQASRPQQSAVVRKRPTAPPPPPPRTAVSSQPQSQPQPQLKLVSNPPPEETNPFEDFDPDLGDAWSEPEEDSPQMVWPGRGNSLHNYRVLEY